MTSRNKAKFLARYAVPGRHFNLEKEPLAYLMSKAVTPADVHRVLTEPSFKLEVKIEAVKLAIMNDDLYCTALAQPDWQLREAVIQRNDLSPRVLSMAYQDQDHYIRLLAIRHPKAAIATIQAALGDSDERVRKFAARVLSEQIPELFCRLTL